MEKRIMKIPYSTNLSLAEKQYLQHLIDGMDEQLIRTGQWLNTPEARHYFMTHANDVQDFFKESGIREELKPLLEANIEGSESYIKQFYKVGAELGYADLNSKLLFTQADQEAFYFLKKYNFDLIKDLNKELQEGIQEVITRSVLEGNGYKETARLLLEIPLTPLENSRISLRQRAEMIARTEHARAVNTGSLQAYTNMGVTEVNILTVGDSDVCDYCLDLEDNNPYSLEEAMTLLPAHPNCRCSYTPVIDSINHEADQVIVNLTEDF